MATITATKAGNWSDTSVWDLGRVPAANDDIALAGYVITWDASAGATLPATGVFTSITSTGTAGQIAIDLSNAAFNSGAALNATTITAGTKPSNPGVVYVTGSTSNVLTITADNMNAGSNVSAFVVNNNATGTVNCVGAVNASATSYGANNASTGTLTITTATGGSGSNAIGANNASTGTLTITTATGGSGSNAYGAYNASNGTLTITTATGGSGSNAYGAYNVSTGTLTITTATGGSGSNAIGANNVSSGTLNCTLAVGGDGGPGGSSANMSAGVNGSATSGAVTTVKRIQYGAYGASPTIGSVKFLDDASNDCQVQIVYGGTTKTLIDSAVGADLPAITDVRKDVIYNNNNLTGTCAVPAAGSVALGVAVDATTGTAVLTPADVWGYVTRTLTEAPSSADIWNYLLTNMTTDGSIGKKLADAVAQTGDVYPVVTNATYGNSALSARIPAALTANGNIKASLVEILTTALTETAGYLAAGFKKFFNIETPVLTVASVNQGADNNVILANASKGLAKVYDDMAKDSTVAKETTLATVASYLDTEIADIKAKTDTITTPPTAAAIADAVLEESLADHKAVANSLAKALLETNQRLNGAKVAIDTDAGTIKVYDTNGTDLLFTLTKTAAGNIYTIARS